MNLQITTYSDCHFDGVAALWREAFADDPPWNAAEIVVPAKVATQPDLLLVAIGDDRVIGSVMAGYDGHRGWLYAVAVAKLFQRQGIGRALIREAERRLIALGTTKINLQIRAANHDVIEFYSRVGYSVEERVSMGKRVQKPA
jgi:ribosomal protein S18 acetylase RimI-like enzyme